MNPLFELMFSLTGRNEPFVLATVISSNGSTPRSAGARMLVREDGSAAGTVGGGILEARVEQLAREVLKTRAAVIQNYQFSGKDAATMDAICGGQVEVLVEWIDAFEPSWKAVLEGIRAATAKHQKAWLLTGLPGSMVESEASQPGVSLPHAVVLGSGEVVGTLPDWLAAGEVLKTLQFSLLENAGQRWMVEPLETGGVVYIFGAGHVGRSLAAFTRAVGFWTVVLDDRPEYANAANIPAADQVVVLDSFENLFSNLPVGADTFIVIVTRGHLNDRLVLSQALCTRAGYIGMIGSQRKCALIFDELRKAGFSKADLGRVHAPIGVPIQAETPEEIGVSITAEMIQVRAGLSNRKT